MPTAAAQALIRNNRPLLAYIAGKPDDFTSKDHNFLPGETVEKQLILINNSRETDYVRLRLVAEPARAGHRARTKPSIRDRAIRNAFRLRFELPATACRQAIMNSRATVRFGSGETQKDTFAVHVLPPPAEPRMTREDRTLRSRRARPASC